MTVERREGPTPAGGAYAEAIYEGDRLVEIVEYDEGGIPLARTYATGIVATRGEGRYLLVQTDETSPPDREPSGPVGRIYDIGDRIPRPAAPRLACVSVHLDFDLPVGETRPRPY